MLRALDIMTRNIAKIRGSATVAEAVRLMKQHQSRSLMVDRRSDEDAYGILTETDVMYKVVALGQDPAAVLVADIMTKPCVVVNPNATLEEVAHLFANHQLLRAPVIQGKILGMITVTDLLSYYPAIAQPHLEAELHHARHQATRICTEQGAESLACIAAWNAVEALQADLARQPIDRLLQHTFEEYCEEFPDGANADFRANLCGG
jgi:CBS domain-containing protein